MPLAVDLATRDAWCCKTSLQHTIDGSLEQNTTPLQIKCCSASRATTIEMAARKVSTGDEEAEPFIEDEEEKIHKGRAGSAPRSR